MKTRFLYNDKSLRPYIVKVATICIILYLLLMGLAFFQQERMIFFPQKLPADYAFSFEQEFEEIFIPARDSAMLHGLLFKAGAPKGLVFYLHGNAGSVATWGSIARIYTDLNYDFFILDYRGFGKSEGNISSETQLYADVQAAYSQLTARYSENKSVIAGYSIGTGPAAMLASANTPRLLILQAPYYSLRNLMQNLYPVIPTFFLKYKFETYRFVSNTEAPIVLFHGEEDAIIPPGSSHKLSVHLKPTDQVIILKRQGHNGMNENADYQNQLTRILAAHE